MIQEGEFNTAYLYVGFFITHNLQGSFKDPLVSGAWSEIPERYTTIVAPLQHHA